MKPKSSKVYKSQGVRLKRRLAATLCTLAAVAREFERGSAEEALSALGWGRLPHYSNPRHTLLAAPMIARSS